MEFLPHADSLIYKLLVYYYTLVYHGFTHDIQFVFALCQEKMSCLNTILAYSSELQPYIYTHFYNMAADTNLYIFLAFSLFKKLGTLTKELEWTCLLTPCFDFTKIHQHQQAITWGLTGVWPHIIMNWTFLFNCTLTHHGLFFEGKLNETHSTVSSGLIFPGWQMRGRMSELKIMWENHSST